MADERDDEQPTDAGPVWRTIAGVVMVRGVAPLATLLLAIVVVGIPLYVFPSQDDVQHADAVLVIGPPMVQRLVTAQALVEGGIAEEMVVSVPDGSIISSRLTPRLDDLCSAMPTEADYPVTCFTPDPFTTRGESQAIARMAEESGWESVIVVTSLPHILRARVLFNRCADAYDVFFVSDQRKLDLSDWAYEYAYQTGAFGKVLLNRSC